MVHELPIHVLDYIFSFLENEDLRALRYVCKQFKSQIHNPPTRAKLVEDGIMNFIKCNKRGARYIMVYSTYESRILTIEVDWNRKVPNAKLVKAKTLSLYNGDKLLGFVDYVGKEEEHFANAKLGDMLFGPKEKLWLTRIIRDKNATIPEKSKHYPHMSSKWQRY